MGQQTRMKSRRCMQRRVHRASKQNRVRSSLVCQMKDFHCFHGRVIGQSLVNSGCLSREYGVRLSLAIETLQLSDPSAIQFMRVCS